MRGGAAKLTSSVKEEVSRRDQGGGRVPPVMRISGGEGSRKAGDGGCLEAGKRALAPVAASRFEEFFKATGVKVRMRFPPLDPTDFGQRDHPVCRLMNAGSRVCEICMATHSMLREQAIRSCREAHASCGAGFTNFVKLVSLSGGEFVVIEGMVRCEPCSTEQLEHVAGRLRAKGLDAEALERGLAMVRQSPVVGSARLSSILGMLECVTNQVVRETDQLARAETLIEVRAVSAAKGWIREHYRERLSVAQIARRAHVSEGHLMKLFKRQTGQTVVQFINRLRVEEAKRLLAVKQLQIAQVAFESGFESVPYFNRIFRRFAGMSPGEFRRGAVV